MRVLITTDTVGGVWDYSLGLAEGLLKRGCELTLVSMGELPSDFQSAAIGNLAETWQGRLSFISTGYPLEWMQGDLQLEQSEKFLLGLIEKIRPHLFHSNQMCFGSLACNIPCIVASHSDVTTWSLFCKDGAAMDGAWYQRYHEVVARGLSAADCVVAPSRFQLDQIEQHYGPIGQRGVVIHNGSQAREAREQKHTQVATAGRFWDAAKNLQILKRVDWPMPIYVAGKIDHNPNQHNCLSDNSSLHPLGQLDKQSFRSLLDRSLIYIGPSLYEPFGLAPLEAAHSGCALVLSDIPSFREIWEDAAVYFPPFEPAELQRAVLNLVAERDHCELMASRSFHRARCFYGAALFADRYYRLYENLLLGQSVNYAA